MNPNHQVDAEQDGGYLPDHKEDSVGVDGEDPVHSPRHGNAVVLRPQGVEQEGHRPVEKRSED
jgi:hypothetical protein